MSRQWAIFSVKSCKISAEEEPWRCHYEMKPAEGAVVP